jgi:uncharacterized tellurite resistance protein B-like protein
MPNDRLRNQRLALEEEFFQHETERLRQRLRSELESSRQRDALARASGISHPDVLDRLIDIGLDAETVLALGLVPLVEVAWADGQMDEKERRAVLAAAREAGIQDATPAALLLEAWLSAAPPPRLREAWLAYVHALCAELDAKQRLELREDLLGRARRVAEAAGGFLGLGSRVSSPERKELDRLEGAFEP